ncbi:MAG: hypothetical protein QF368_18860, partial [SAR202 cluster bacterium]|nr:hypothetical protein [SAR202 cluster bacterium]
MNRFGLILFAIMVTVIGAAVTSAVWNGAASAHDDGELPFVEFDEGVVGSVNVQNDVQTVVFSPSGKLIDADDSFNDAAPTLKMLGAVVTKTFTDFTSSNLSSLQLNNNTATQNPNSDDVLRLTSAGTNKSGSAFLTDTISLGSQSSFSTAFQFRIHSSGGSFQGGGADGLVFVVQTVSNSAGTTGSGIGYKGINNSVGIEFDTFNNGTSEGACESSFGENHVGINVGGSICSNPQIDVTSSLGALDAGTTFFAWVDFDGSSNDLEVRLSTTASRPSTALLSKNVDLVAELGTSDAFVGFTSATGGSFSAHDIVAWQFTNSFQPIQEIVPDPEADLELTKTDSPDPVIAGANLTYTITVTNNSTSTAASNVQIKDKLPSGTSLVSAVVTGGSCSGTTEITCSF